MEEGAEMNIDRSEMYFVLKGQLSVSIGGISIRCLDEGDHFGELALFSKGKRTASVQAVTEVRLMAVSYPRFLYLIKHTP